MNFLAHAVLAGDDPALIVGGVAGDWIKGPLPGALPADLARGVALHRAIDRHAGILVDIYYDHLLARDWPQDPPLADACRCIYRHIADRLADLPDHARPAMALMADEDWLASYARLAGIADVLRRMGRRARQPNPLAGGEAEFIADAAGFAADYERWYLDARGFAAEWRAGQS